MSLSYHVDTLHDTLVVWQVMQLIQETKFIAKLGLEVPPIAHKLLFLVPTLKSTKLIMEQLVDSYTLLVARVPERLAKALDPAVRRLQAKMVPGVNKISWMSVNVDEFLAESSTAMEVRTCVCGAWGTLNVLA